MKTAVVYWSGTGNTEAMAKAVAEGMTAAGAEAVLLTPDKVQPGDLNAYDAIAFGCPAMGSEVLEEMEFQPMFDACKRSLGGKRAAVSYTHLDVYKRQVEHGRHHAEEEDAQIGGGGVECLGGGLHPHEQLPVSYTHLQYHHTHHG